MKVIFVGMCNPQGNPPLHALASAGAGKPISESAWRSRFDFMNVLRGSKWDPVAAREAAPALLERLRGRRAVLLGPSVAHALRLPATLPSGRNRWYNEPLNKRLVEQFLAGLYRERA